MTFFEPSDAYIKWLGKYTNLRITIDCGSGDGDLVRKLLKEGVKALGIEPFWVSRACYNPMLPVLASTVQRCKTIKDKECLILIARPDHSGWVSWVAHNAHPKSEILYISKPSNCEVDLEGWKLIQLETPPCNEEQTYRIARECGRPIVSSIHSLVDCLGPL